MGREQSRPNFNMTTLTFNRTIPGEDSGLSPAERLAVAIFEIEATIDETSTPDSASTAEPSEAEQILDQVFLMLNQILPIATQYIAQSYKAQQHLGLSTGPELEGEG